MWDQVDINWLAVLAATVGSVVVGALWFSNVMFAKPWMAGIGRTREEIEADFSPALYVIAVVSGAVSAIGLSIVADWGGADTLVEGLVVGALMALFFWVAPYVVNASFERRSTSLQMINAGHDLATFSVMGAVIGAWQ